MKFKKALPFVLAGSVVMCSTLAHAATIYVKAGSSGGGTDWTDAYGDLQTALAAASEGDEIWVAAGTYKPGTNRTDSFVMRRRVKLYGGFEGVVSETSLSHRKPDVHLTILSGDIDNDGLLDADNSIHVVRAVSTNMTTGAIDRDTLLDGFIITMGYADGSTNLDDFGGGMLIAYASPVIQNCVFTRNYSLTPGGAAMYIHSEQSSDATRRLPVALPLVRDCAFVDNCSGTDLN